MRRPATDSSIEKPAKKRRVLFSDDAPQVFTFEKIPGERANVLNHKISLLTSLDSSIDEGTSADAGLYPSDSSSMPDVGSSGAADLMTRMLNSNSNGGGNKNKTSEWWDLDEAASTSDVTSTAVSGVSSKDKTERELGMHLDQSKIEQVKNNRKAERLLQGSKLFNADDFKGEVNLVEAMVEIEDDSLTLTKEEAASITPFNMSDMQSEGRVDEGGNFIMGRQDEGLPEMSDAWVRDNVINNDDKTLEKTKVAAEAKRKRMEENEAKQEAEGIPYLEALALLGHVDASSHGGPELQMHPYLQTPDETPAMAMQRIKGIPTDPKLRKKMKFLPKLDSTKRSLIDKITDLCQVLFDKMTSDELESNISVYSTKRSVFESMACKKFNMKVPVVSSITSDVDSYTVWHESDSAVSNEVDSWYYIKVKDDEEEELELLIPQGPVQFAQLHSISQEGFKLRVARGASPLDLPPKEEFKTFRNSTLKHKTMLSQ